MAGGATGRWCALLVATAALAPVPAAAAQRPIPPGNSAVDQYTESYPGAGGDRTTRGGEGAAPAQVLGPRKAQRLQSRGRAGRQTAALVAATSPLPTAGDGGAPAEGRGGAPGSGSAGPADGAASQPGAGRDGDAPPAARGASGVGEVLGRALGFSTDTGAGNLLPLAVLATALWALAFLWRRRRYPT